MKKKEKNIVWSWDSPYFFRFIFTTKMKVDKIFFKLVYIFIKNVVVQYNFRKIWWHFDVGHLHVMGSI